jgi:iron(III) transport system substrate-binding protein
MLAMNGNWKRKLGALCLLGWIALALAPAGAADLAGPAALYQYQGADRLQKLVEGAHREGTMTLYTSLNPKDAGPIVEAFENRYKIKVVVWRARGEKMVQRALTEARAGRFTPDVFESDGVEMEILS